ncbi:MAG TPA: ChaB family protein [Oculatellaceae cyanobacterium]|jgi:cation transport regulator
MSDKQLDGLPQEVTAQLPEDAQHIFQASFKSATEGGMSQEGAMDVAWNTVRDKYEQDGSGSWQRKPEDTNQHNKSVQSGGN